MALQFSLNHDSPLTVQTDCIIIGCYADHTLSPAAQQIDRACQGKLSALAKSGDLGCKPGKHTWIYGLDGLSAPRLLVVGLGEQPLTHSHYLKAIHTAVHLLRESPCQRAYLTLSELPIAGRDAAWAIRQAVVAADHAAYRYTATVGPAHPSKLQQGIDQLAIYGQEAQALALGMATAKGVEFTRELGNLPPNRCTPSYLAETAMAFANQHPGVTAEILDDTQMHALGMGALLAVAQGSSQRPRLIVLTWKGEPNSQPIVCVGKGITFDTGGVNLKTQGGIEEMKYDMCGGATVLGTFVAAVTAKLPIHLIAIVPAVENAIDGNAYRPSDVITSLSGKTIEVGNTDAEGRLILCDALTYAERFKPAALIDVATLTGACMVALGQQAAGLMSKHDDLAAELLQAGEQVDDRAWQLPLWDDYQSLLDSTFADVYNIGGRNAGAITAGCFLSRFTEGQRWAHLDIAGVASESGKRGMATGRPVNLLVQWLLNQVSHTAVGHRT